jgi:hypothetical protein
MRLSGGKNLSLLQIASTKLYCYHSVIINVIGINRNLSLIVVNIISLPQEVRGIFVIKAAVEMQNNLPFCD